MDNTRVQYIINKENGVVVATINSCDCDAEKIVNSKFIPNVTSGFTIMNNYDNDKFYMNSNYKAIAKRHPDDKWDARLGKKIANDKLTEAYHNGLNKRLKKYANDFRKIADDIDKYLEDRHFNVTKS